MDHINVDREGEREIRRREEREELRGRYAVSR
jgi:hypothetical protein